MISSQNRFFNDLHISILPLTSRTKFSGLEQTLVTSARVDSISAFPAPRRCQAREFRVLGFELYVCCRVLDLIRDDEGSLIEWAYGRKQMDPDDPTAVKDTVIQCADYSSVLQINEAVRLTKEFYRKFETNTLLVLQVLDILPGEPVTLKSIDTFCKNSSEYLSLPEEMYNRRTPEGFPPHNLRLKQVLLIICLYVYHVIKGLSGHSTRGSSAYSRSQERNTDEGCRHL